MKKVKTIWLLMLLIVPLFLLGGCESVTTRANTQDTWSRIQRRKRVVIGLDDSFVPMGYRQKNGKLVGYDIDLAKAVFKQYGIKADFQTIDWSMKETELKNGTIVYGTAIRLIPAEKRRLHLVARTLLTARSWLPSVVVTSMA